MSLRVGTANVKFTLPTGQAGRVLGAQLAEVDVTILNEWDGKDRLSILEYTGRVLLPINRLFVRKAPTKGWVWAQSKGVAVGVDAERIRVRRVSRRELHTQRRVGRKFGSTHLAHRYGVAILGVDRETGEKVAFVGFHLPAGVEGRAGYQRDDPARRDAHLDARRELENWARSLRRRGFKVWMAGDTNFDDLQLAGLESCWGKSGPGTHGRRTLDSIYSTEELEDVEKHDSASDHDRVVATY